MKKIKKTYSLSVLISPDNCEEFEQKARSLEISKELCLAIGKLLGTGDYFGLAMVETSADGKLIPFPDYIKEIYEKD